MYRLKVQIIQIIKMGRGDKCEKGENLIEF